jgi:hypothetical protein
VRTAAAVLPVLVRSWERIELAELPVTLTPFALRQLLKAARAELLITRLKPLPKPVGAYLAHALNTAEFRPANPLGRGDPDGKAPGEKDARGRVPNCPGLTVTPCCFRHVSKALSLADAVELAEAPAAAALPPLPPQPASTSAPASAGSAARIRAPRMMLARMRKAGMANRRSVVPPFMVISSKVWGYPPKPAPRLVWLMLAAVTPPVEFLLPSTMTVSPGWRSFTRTVELAVTFVPADVATWTMSPPEVCT